MTNIVLVTEDSLTTVKAPTLPLAPVQYQQKYQDEFANILRLYFNQIDAFVTQITLGLVYVTADLPDAVDAGAGARAFVTDASVSTFGATVVGGGTTNVPVYSDGAVWKVG